MKHILYGLVLLLAAQSTARGQATPKTSLLVTGISNITTAYSYECGGVTGCIDNRSTYLRYNNYHAVTATGTGSWQVQIQFANGSPTNFSSCGTGATITQSSNPAVAFCYGYYDYINVAITGTGASSVVASYSGQNQLLLSTVAGSVSFPITVPQGGTGISTVPANSVLYGNGGPTLSFVNPGSQYQVYQVNVNGVPVLAGVNLSSANAVLGTLGIFNGGTGSTTASGALSNLLAGSIIPVTSGGTGRTAFNQNQVIVGNNTNSLNTITGSQFQVLTTDNTGNAIWGQVNLGQSASVTGVLGPSNGGLGSTNLTGIAYLNATQPATALSVRGNSLIVQLASGSTVTNDCAKFDINGNLVDSGNGCSSLLSAADSTVVSNISGISAVPVSNTVTAVLDHSLGSTQGMILYRGASNWSTLGPGTSGFYLQTSGAGANPQWSAVPALTSAANGTVVSNISGGSATPVSNSLSSVLDAVIGNTQGAVIFRGAAAWSQLVPGTNGQFLQTQGGSSNPQWATVTGGLGSASDSTVVSNISGGAAVPIANTLTSVLDHDITNVQGSILYRSGAAWVSLAPGSTGQFLQTQGSSANPQWAAAGGGLAAAADSTVVGNITGVTSVPASNTLTATLDHVFGNSQGSLLVRGASNWQVLSPGTNGQFLQTQGASAAPVWASPGGSAWISGFNNSLYYTAGQVAIGISTAGAVAGSGDRLAVEGGIDVSSPGVAIKFWNPLFSAGSFTWGISATGGNLNIVNSGSITRAYFNETSTTGAEFVGPTGLFQASGFQQPSLIAMQFPGSSTNILSIRNASATELASFSSTGQLAINVGTAATAASFFNSNNSGGNTVSIINAALGSALTVIGSSIFSGNLDFANHLQAGSTATPAISCSPAGCSLVPCTGFPANNDTRGCWFNNGGNTISSALMTFSANYTSVPSCVISSSTTPTTGTWWSTNGTTTSFTAFYGVFPTNYFFTYQCMN